MADDSAAEIDLSHARGVIVGDNATMLSVFNFHTEGTRSLGQTHHPDDPGQHRRVLAAYQAQISDMAPSEGLSERDTELRELAHFCSGEEAYLYWQGNPWSGKTALMTTFALQPPENVIIVSFFVSARLAGHADSTAFTDVILDQLSALAGKDVPHGHAARRDAYRRSLTKEVAEDLGQRGMRLLVLVDGLDEDSGGREGARLPSIASLLPKECPAGLKVVVSGRFSPAVPDDVDPDHPIRHCRRRNLLASSRAGAIARAAKLELSSLLLSSDSPLNLHILGLLTASDGGLAIRDLAELTGATHFDVADRLGGAFGRTVALRWNRFSGQPDTSCVFAHEELREQADAAIGPTQVMNYRKQINQWANRYRHAGWPDATPSYLLNGYPRLLARCGDVEALSALVLDVGRHERMFELTGGDADAYGEIHLAQYVEAARDDPDFLALIRLARYERQLENLNAHLPRHLPTVWAAMGNVDQAEALARSISSPGWQVEALVAIVGVLIQAGESARAADLIETAEGAAHRIGRLEERMTSLASLAVVAIKAGKSDQAEAIAARAESIKLPHHDSFRTAVAKKALVKVIAAAGKLDRAKEVALGIAHDSERVRALGHLVDALVEDGKQMEAKGICADAVNLARQVRHPGIRTHVMVDAVRMFAVAGCFQDAKDASNEIEDHVRRAGALAGAVKKAALHGDLDQLERIASQIADAEASSAAWTAIVAAADEARQKRARIMAQNAALEIANPYLQNRALAALVKAAAQAGQLDAAEKVMRCIKNLGWRRHCIPSLVEAAAEAGDIDRADAISQRLRKGRRADQHDRDWLCIPLAKAAALAGDLNRAKGFADAIGSYQLRADAFTKIAEVLVAAGDSVTAKTFASEAARTIRSNSHDRSWAGVESHLVEALTITGNIDTAENVALGTDKIGGARRKSVTAVAVATSADLARSRRVIGALEDPADQVDIHIAVLAQLAPGPTWRAQLEITETLAFTLKDVSMRASALSRLALVCSRVDEQRCQRLIAAAEGIAKKVSGTLKRAWALSAVANSAAGFHKPTATRLLRSAENLASKLSWIDQEQMQHVVLDSWLAAGELKEAERIAYNFRHRRTQAIALIRICNAAIRLGDRRRARHLAREAEEFFVSLNQAVNQDLLLELVRSISALGDTKWCGRVIAEIRDPAAFAEAKAWNLKAATVRGHSPTTSRALAEAIESAREIDSGYQRALALLRLAHFARTTLRDVNQMRSLTVEALLTGRWFDALPFVARIQPSAIESLAAEYVVLRGHQTRRRTRSEHSTNANEIVEQDM